MLSKHGVPSSTELVRDNMAEYEDEANKEKETTVSKSRPNTRSAKYANY